MSSVTASFRLVRGVSDRFIGTGRFNSPKIKVEVVMRIAALALLPVMLAPAVGTVHAEEEHGFWWYQEAKIACMGDVMRLCRGFVPDEDKVRACMKDKKAQVSEGCAEFYPGGAKAN